MSRTAADRFNDITSTQEREWAEIRAAAVANGLDLSDPIVRQMDEESIGRAEDAYKALLGEQGFSNLMEYRKTMITRRDNLGINALLTTSYGTDQSIACGVVNQLAKICADNHVFDISGAIESGNEPDFDACIANARKLLSPDQMDTYELLIDSQRIAYGRSRLLSATHPTKD